MQISSCIATLLLYGSGYLRRALPLPARSPDTCCHGNYICPGCCWVMVADSSIFKAILPGNRRLYSYLDTTDRAYRRLQLCRLRLPHSHKPPGHHVTPHTGHCGYETSCDQTRPVCRFLLRPALVRRLSQLRLGRATISPTSLK
ncbi:hypothetical protein F5B22DRAFT_106600 [Xylaria bambusicola]|uniref:uncharacterized protein n=1 Tax=Xylaria bambusicola TaxID=326684 RepID=UPI002008D986|nr:uncharacterized protein F5B22DRAFT_106600 [Xylaria bambusicola]KAI0517481.1 hypothetical protein F5B22DRAFT_106600 [Xylaria bambusicola]